MNTEEDLIKRLKNPRLKEEAFRELFDMYQQRLYWHIRKIVITHDNANDVLQDTFIRIYKGIDNFQARSTLHTWMYKIAYNESIRFIGKNMKEVGSAIAEGPDDYLKTLVADEYFNGEEIQFRLHEIMASLTEKQRRVFQMKYFDDLSFREISEILDVNENTLKSSYYSVVKIIEEKIVA